MSTYRLPKGLLTPASLAEPLLTVLKVGRAKYRGGLPPALVAWIRDLEDLADEPPAATPSAPVAWISIAAAAASLGLSERQTRALASRMGGRKVAGRWALPAVAVIEEAEARSAAVGGREVAAVA